MKKYTIPAIPTISPYASPKHTVIMESFDDTKQFYSFFYTKEEAIATQKTYPPDTISFLRVNYRNMIHEELIFMYGPKIISAKNNPYFWQLYMKAKQKVFDRMPSY